ncbi:MULTISPECIES: thioredoxin [Eisenbergiella]|uniref:Thioredoxin n=1 Tax=Eisenbergiella porci TaxID=2652274 RepID=A0A6N7W441_9FIRM|nr:MULTISPECIES: thioredoxin [Eisenbergiella]MDY2652732.1 thioredoxin [Eisenbergiella porci]MSS90019.1 thioredoxin [Eisenbergiella porci]
MEYKFTSADFEKEVLQSDKPVLVDFFADWCGPCKMMAPVVEQLAKELEGKAKVGKLNIDENMDIAEKYRVMNIPTFLIFKDGQEKERIVGAVSKNELKNKLEQTLA